MIQIANVSAHGFNAGFFAGAAMYSTARADDVALRLEVEHDQQRTRYRGRSVAVPALTSLTSLAAKEWLATNGADLAKISIFELPFAEMAPARVRGTIGAAMIGEPFITFAKDDVRAIAKPFDVIARSFYIGGWFAPRVWANENADLMRRFTLALYATARYANTHQSVTLPWLGKYSKLDVNRVRTMHRVTWAASLDPKLMQPVLDIATKYKEIDRPMRAEDLLIRT